MKGIFTINDTLTNKISYYHILAFLVALPFDRFYSELVLASLLLHELIHINRPKLSGLKMPVMITGLLYLLTLVSTIYSAERGQALKDLEKQLALILFPFIFSITSLDVRKYCHRILKVFALTCMMASTYLYIDALRIINYNKLPLSALMSTSFINHNFSLPFNLHATMLAMYVTLAAAYVLNELVRSVKAGERLLYVLGLLVLLATVIQLSSKSVMIAILVIFNIAFPLLMLQKKARWKFMLASLFVSFMVIVVIAGIPSFKERYIAGSKNDLAQVAVRNDLVEPRMLRWHSAVELVEKSLLVGYGSGTEVKLLQEKYFEKHLFNSYIHALNAHNQYLSFLLKTGIIGLCIYLLVLYTAFKKAVAARNLVFCAFIIIIAIVSFSENILDVNKGIFFFSFFYGFFMKINQDHTAEVFDFARP